MMNIKYDPAIDKLRDEFITLNVELKEDGKASLKEFLDICHEEGINPHREYSGKFNLRVPPALHAEIAAKAAAEGN